MTVASGGTLAKAAGVAATVTQAGGSAFSVVTDVRSPTMITTVVAELEQRFGRIDIQVNSAGIYAPTPVGDTVEAVFDDLVATNLRA